MMTTAQIDVLSMVADREDGPVAASGPWIPNVMRGRYHRTVQRGPSAATSAETAYSVLGDHYEIRVLDLGWKGKARAAAAHVLVCHLAHDCSVDCSKRDMLTVCYISLGALFGGSWCLDIGRNVIPIGGWHFGCIAPG